MIDSGNEKKVQELAKSEIVNVPDDRGGYTSLHHAALKGKKGQPPIFVLPLNLKSQK